MRNYWDWWSFARGCCLVYFGVAVGREQWWVAAIFLLLIPAVAFLEGFVTAMRRDFGA